MPDRSSKLNDFSECDLTVFSPSMIFLGFDFLSTEGFDFELLALKSAKKSFDLLRSFYVFLGFSSSDFLDPIDCFF